MLSMAMTMQAPDHSKHLFHELLDTSITSVWHTWHHCKEDVEQTLRLWAEGNSSEA